MTPEHEKIVIETINNMPDWFWGRLWDDDCICPDEKTVDIKCKNKRCIRDKHLYLVTTN